MAESPCGFSRLVLFWISTHRNLRKGTGQHVRLRGAPKEAGLEAGLLAYVQALALILDETPPGTYRHLERNDPTWFVKPLLDFL